MKYTNSQIENEKSVKSLYEKYPYPNKGINSKKDALRYIKWISQIFNKDLNFWKNKNVLELGCGTGELANSLALFGANVKAIDLSKSSINKAKETSKKLNTKINFLNENILKFKDNKKYDVVIALGSLHHTVDAKKGFVIATNHLDKNGIIIVGIYNKYSRFRHRLKRIVLRIFAGKDIDKRINLGKKLFKTNNSPSWLADKYGQTHESYHSINEILKWFNQNNIEFIASKPKFNTPIIDEIRWLIKKENAFFVMIGQKKSI
ncbi:MAG: class I SAM-dependent methyltransferase [Candidatus ainarchaeum sp.]|nr:class I SAM-dependent methyltransferase [Candidatus ainarchaeum sp.]